MCIYLQYLLHHLPFPLSSISPQKSSILCYLYYFHLDCFPEQYIVSKQSGCIQITVHRYSGKVKMCYQSHALLLRKLLVTKTQLSFFYFQPWGTQFRKVRLETGVRQDCHHTKASLGNVLMQLTPQRFISTAEVLFSFSPK